ncbi:cytochrome P450 3A12 [Caerostris extrusa]|uniref:Cytochrome P450 3A12 n=1 Tax=Caerostris extrusa TaxID=172846 RepID=A0AAV4N176_CAEEX|nr:cytochrome P450 3A12 [Caerostris extrusa]
MLGLELLYGPVGITLWIGFISVLFYWYSTRNFDYWKKRNVPYVKPYPLMGTLAESFFNVFHEVENKRYKELGRIYGHFEGTNPVLSVAEPDLLRSIFVKDFTHFANRRSLATGDEIVDKMVSVVNGEDWKRIRTIITPTFSTGKIKRVMSIFKDCAKTAVENFKSEIASGKTIEVKRIFGAFTMDVIASSAFSTKIDSHNNPDNMFVAKARKVFRQTFSWRFLMFFLCPSLMKLLKISVFPPSITSFFASVTLQIMEERTRTGQTRNDFLQLLMDTTKELADDPNSELNEKESGDLSVYGGVSTDHQVFKGVNKKKLSQNELIGNCVIFFLAGYDTTASTLSFVSYLLALNPDIQEKLHQELVDTLEKTNGELTYEALQGMKYLDNIISETMRLYPPATRMERQCTQDYELGNTGISIPKGMILTVPVCAMHRDPQNFPDPEKFDPDRFSTMEKAGRDQYTYLPFGAGPRNCVGMRFALTEIKVCLAFVVANFKISKCPETRVPLEFLTVQGLLQPKDIILKMELREDNPLRK